MSRIGLSAIIFYRLSIMANRKTRRHRKSEGGGWFRSKSQPPLIRGYGSRNLLRRAPSKLNRMLDLIPENDPPPRTRRNRRNTRKH